MYMIGKYSIIIALAVAMAGCAAMDKMAGMGVVTQSTSTFDNATIIEASPNSLYAPGNALGTPLQMGARWSSAAPDSVAIVLAYNANVSGSAPAYLGLSAIEINIDGTVSSYSAGQQTDMNSSGYNTVSHTIYTSSRNAIVVPYSVLQRMVAAKDCRLRIHTSSGYQDIDFSAEHIPGGKATAILSIKELMAKVARVRAAG
ncbi:MAG: hypothetical protein ABS82_01145 [Rhodanobacter sp. SCN 67-45]|nr:MAG: hypothetical protein ABS82_01145 [Rhodanobacter sp. SCN 67-45]